MTISLKHSFTSAKADGTDSTLVQPSNWNEEHALSLAAGKVLGRVTGAAGVAQELPLAFDATLQSMIPPTGTTAERPATPAAGMMRYNSTTLKLEIYTNAAWTPVGGSAAVSATAPTSPQPGDLWYDSSIGTLKVYNGTTWVVNQVNQSVNVFSGNGSTTVFTLSQAASSSNNVDVFISGVYQQKSTYTVSGTTLTFSTAPVAGTGNIEAQVTAPVAAGVPNDNSVSTVKIQDTAVTTAKLQDSGVTTVKIANANVTQAKLAADVGTYNDGRFSPLMGHLWGLPLSNNVVDAVNDIDIGVGAAADATGAYVMRLLVGTTKRLDAAWAAGSGNGGRDTGAIADGWWHVWLIGRSDTGATDVLFSLSATAPTMPASYDFKRRIGSVLRQSAAIRAFTYRGDYVEWVTPSLDVNQNNPGTSAVAATLTVPTGIVVKADMYVSAGNGTTGVWGLVTSLTTTDSVPSQSLSNFSNDGAASRTTYYVSAYTNTSGQVRYRCSASSASVPLTITTFGYADTRGRIA